MPVAFLTTIDDDGARPDHALRRHHPAVDRAFALQLLKEGRIVVDGEVARLAARLRPGVRVVVQASSERLGPAHVEPFTLVWQGEGVVVVDKAPGIAMHDGMGISGHEQTLHDLIAARFSVEPGFDGPSFLGRLDRPTSGLVLTALSRAGLRSVEPAWSSGALRKEYVVVVHGHAPATQHIDIALAARGARGKGSGRVEEARTSITTLAHARGLSLVVAELHTGRTHQIRRHMKAIGHPLVGDPRYGDARRDDALGGHDDDGLLLHAWRIRHDGACAALPTLLTAPWPARVAQRCAKLGIDVDTALHRASSLP